MIGLKKDQGATHLLVVGHSAEHLRRHEPLAAGLARHLWQSGRQFGESHQKTKIRTETTNKKKHLSLNNKRKTKYEIESTSGGGEAEARCTGCDHMRLPFSPSTAARSTCLDNFYPAKVTHSHCCSVPKLYDLAQLGQNEFCNVFMVTCNEI